MKRIFIASVGLVMALSSCRGAAAENATPPAKESVAAEATVPAQGGEVAAPKVEKSGLAGKERVSYALGMQIGQYLGEVSEEIDVASFIRGVTDKLDGKTALLTDEEADAARREFFMKMQEAQQQKVMQEAEKNKKAADEFLAKNKAEKSVVTTASGLQYIVVKEGDGPNPTATDNVRVHYRGTLLDGTEFDSSFDRAPAVFPVGNLIPGWSEALQLMKVGGEYKLFVPPNLGYGVSGAGGVIPPNALLIFEVRLLGIEAPQENKSGIEAPQKETPPATVEPEAER